MTQLTQKNFEQGFTLVEVMIALMILAIALGAIIRVTTESATGAFHLRNKTVAQWVAMNIFTEYKLGMRQVPKTLDPQEGEAQMLNQTWYWTAQFRPTEYKSLLRIEVLVRLIKNKRDLIHLSTFLWVA